MSSVKPNHLAELIRSQAASIVKSASSSTGAPSTADGVVQVTPGVVPVDPGAAELKKQMLPKDGMPGDDTDTLIPGENLNPSGTPSADKGAPAGMPSMDGGMPKMAAERVSNVRNALLAAIPGLAKAASPAAAPAPAVTTASPDASKSAAAGESGLDLSPDMLVKLAKTVLSTNEGVAFARYALEKSAGAEHAEQMIKAARDAAVAHDDSLFIKQAAYQEGMTKAAAIHQQLCGIITEAEADGILKQAALHVDNLDALEHDLLKQAYATGMEDAAALEGGVEEGAAEPEMPMGGEQLTMEDVVALLQEMIASGEISKEDVVAGLSELQGAEGAEGAPAAPEEAMAAAPAEPAMA